MGMRAPGRRCPLREVSITNEALVRVRERGQHATVLVELPGWEESVATLIGQRNQATLMDDLVEPLTTDARQLPRLRDCQQGTDRIGPHDRGGGTERRAPGRVSRELLIAEEILERFGEHSCGLALRDDDVHALLKFAHGLLELAETIFKRSMNPILRFSRLDGHDVILRAATRASIGKEPSCRATVDVDDAALAAARAALGTQGLSATINSALREVARRHALADFDVLRDIDGTPDEVQSGRTARGGTTTE